jgi:multidrug resistance efflux pump
LWLAASIARFARIQYHRSVRGKWFLLGGVAALVALGAGTIFLLKRLSPNPPARTAAPAASPQFNGPVVSLPGRVEAAETVSVAVPFDGVIESLPVGVGQNVSEGDLLAEIRSSVVQSQKDASAAALSRLNTRAATLESTLIAARLEAARAEQAAGAARAALDEAQKNLSRQQLLYSKGAGARQALDKAQAAFDTATEAYQGQQKVSEIAAKRVADLSKDLDALQQEVADGSKALEDNTATMSLGDVRSPVDGYVIARKGQVGDEVTADIQDLFQIAVNTTHLRVVLEPPPPVLAKIHPGEEAAIQVAELTEGIQSKVSEVRDGQVIIEFASPDPVIKPGMTVQVVIKIT